MLIKDCMFAELTIWEYEYHIITNIQSPLMWGRGLKLLHRKTLCRFAVSPLMWGHGLKLSIILNLVKFCKVVPHVGAWIERNV